MNSIKLLVSALLCIFALPVGATRYYVKPTATGDGTGNSWANASYGLSAILNAAISGDEVWVAAGTYVPTLDPLGNSSPANPRHKTFYVKDGVKLYGGFAGSETTLTERSISNYQTILTGARNFIGEGCYHVVLSSGPTTGAVGVTIDGFSIRDGDANDNQSIVVNGNSISSNWGGGLCILNGINTLSNNTIYNNSSSTTGGGILSDGSSIGSHTTLSNNTIYNNSATRSDNTGTSGGGVTTLGGTHSFLNNIIYSNQATNGGGISCSGTNTFTNNVIYNNSSTQYGGGVLCSNSTSTFYNNTIYSNSVTTNNGLNNAGGGGMASENSNLTIKNTIFWGNKLNNQTTSAYTDFYAITYHSALTISHCLLQDFTAPYPGTLSNNIYGIDPLFANPAIVVSLSDNVFRTAEHGLALQGSSPAKNTGTNIGASTTDILGNNRVATTDIGAYEFQYVIPTGPTTRYVKEAATGTGDGSTWANASSNLSAMLNLSAAGGEVWVAAGIYRPATDFFGSASPTDIRDKTFFIPDGVKLYGGFAGTETAIAQRSITTPPTTLTGVILGSSDNCYHVVTASAPSSGGIGVTIDGFSIISGQATGNSGIVVQGNVIYSNVGGGIHISRGTNTVSNNTIYDNTAGNNFGGGVDGGGGGIYTYFGTNTLNNNTIYNNSSANHGGGIYTSSGTNTCNNNTIYSNSTFNYGGGVYTQYGTGTWNNNTIYANNASNGDFNNTISGGGGMSMEGGNITIQNTLFWGNTQSRSTSERFADIFKSSNTTVTIQYSFLQFPNTSYSGITLSNNLYERNPRFMNPGLPAGADGKPRTADDGLALQIISPAANAGTTTGAPTTDILGNNRLGNPDIGAYEQSSISVIRYVKTTSEGTGDGSSWTNASNNLSAMLSASVSGDQVWVSAGTYLPRADAVGNPSPTDPRKKTFFVPDGVKLYGGFAGTETTVTQRSIAANGTTLSGDIGMANLNFDNSYHVVLAVTTSDGMGVTIDGFSITLGNANGGHTATSNGTYENMGGGIYTVEGYNQLSNNTIYNNVVGNYGGGIAAIFGNNTLINNVLYGNSAAHGGGVYASNSNTTLTNNKIYTNTGSNGGGVYISGTGSTNTLHGNEISLNTVSLRGGGIYLDYGTNQLTNNNIFNNTSSNFQGGGIYASFGTNTFSKNAIHTNSAITGGGIYTHYGVDAFNNNIIYNNSVTSNGGGIYSYYGTHHWANNTIYNNSATTNGGGVATQYSTMTFRNTLFRSNTQNNSNSSIGADFFNVGSAVTSIRYCLLQLANVATNYPSVTLGNNVYNQDPLFVNAAHPAGADSLLRTSDDGLQLRSGSPALNVGLGIGVTPTDILGNSRIGTPDIGAYEGATVVANCEVTTNQTHTIRQGTSIVVHNNTYVVSGIYRDTIFRAGLCDSIIVTNLTVITCNVTVSIGTNGNTLTANALGGQGGYTFLWNNQATTSTLNNAVIGTTYQVTVTDLLGCTATATLVLAAPTQSLYQLQVTGVECGSTQGTLHVNMNATRTCIDALTLKVQFDTTKIFFENNMTIQNGTAIPASGVVLRHFNRDTLVITVDLDAGCIQGTSGTNVLNIPFRLHPSFVALNANSLFRVAVLEERVSTGAIQDNTTQTFQIVPTLVGKVSVLRPNGAAVKGTTFPMTLLVGDSCNRLTRTIAADTNSKAIVRLDSFRFVQFNRPALPAVASPLIGGFDVFLVRAYWHGDTVLTVRQKIAADVNNDGVITPLDITILRRRAIGIYTNFADYSGGRLTSDYQFTVSTNPDTSKVCFALPARSTMCDTPSIQVTMITLGDLNGDTDTNPSGRIERENEPIAKMNSKVILNLHRATRVADEWKIPVYANQVTRGLDLQLLNLNLNPNVFRVAAVNANFDVLGNGNGSNYYIVGNANALQGIAAHDTLFYLYMKTSLKECQQLGQLKGYLDAQLIVTDCLSAATGLTDVETNGFEMYPNPTEGNLQMTIQQPLSNPTTLRIYDMLGRCVQTTVLQSGNRDFTIDISDLVKGVYQFQFENQFQKVVKH